jgi:REP element-mobilizing transposase RayT
MNLSEVGNHAASCWEEIPSHHPNVSIDGFIVMPNHVHGIIVLSGPEILPKLRKSNEIRQIAELSSVHPKTGSLGTVVDRGRTANLYRKIETWQCHVSTVDRLQHYGQT